MALYKVKGPDGKLHEFQGPEGMPNDLVNMLAGDYFQPEAAPAPVAKPQAETGFIPSVMRGGRGMYSLLGDVAPAMIGKAVGAEDYAKRQMQEAAAYQKETEEKYPSAIPSYTDIKGVGDAVTYIVESVGEAIPSILPSLFTGGAAAIAGRTAVAAARSAAEKAVISNAAKGLGEAELKQAAMTAGVEAAKREALKYEAAGALAGSAVQNIPDVYQNLYEKGKDDLGTALAFGAFNSVLDAVTPINLLRKAKLSGIPEEQIIGAWYKRAGKGMVEGFATEGGTEMLQEMSSAAAEKFVDENNNFFTPENFERFINAGLKGGLGGGVITSATNVATGRAAAPGAPEAGESQTNRVKAETARVEQELGMPPAPETESTPALNEVPVPETTTTPQTSVAAAPTVTTPVPAVKPLSEVQRIKKENELAAAEATLAAYQARGVKGTPVKFTQNRIARLKAELGVANAAGPITPTVGEGANVPASGSGAVPPTGGPETPQRDGMVPAGPNAGNVAQGEGRQPAPVELPDNAKKAIEDIVNQGWTSHEDLDLLYDEDSYIDDDGFVQGIPPLLKNAQRKAAEAYFDSLVAAKKAAKPKTAEPTEVLDEDKIINKTDLAPDEKTEDEYRAEQMSAMQTEEEELNKKSMAEATNLPFDELSKKTKEGANAPGKVYTATYKETDTDLEGNRITTPMSVDYKVARMDGGWTVISDLDGSNPVLLPPSRSAANTDEQLVQQRNNEKTFRTDTVVKPKGKKLGTKTSKTKQAEAQRQETTDTVPVEQRNMYDEEAEFHNETNPERKLPVYKDLTPEQKTTYFSKIKKNNLDEHGTAINVSLIRI
jgi:hypothetical protein